MQPETIKQLIEKGLPDATVFVDGDGAHFNAIVVSSQFIGHNRIQKQQIVYATVKQVLLDGSLHALSIKTYTPEEWDQLQQQTSITVGT